MTTVVNPHMKYYVIMLFLIFFNMPQMYTKKHAIFSGQSLRYINLFFGIPESDDVITHGIIKLTH